VLPCLRFGLLFEPLVFRLKFKSDSVHFVIGHHGSAWAAWRREVFLAPFVNSALFVGIAPFSAPWRRTATRVSAATAAAVSIRTVVPCGAEVHVVVAVATVSTVEKISLSWSLVLRKCAHEIPQNVLQFCCIHAVVVGDIVDRLLCLRVREPLCVLLLAGILHLLPKFHV
jgi:hypothetical protein